MFGSAESERPTLTNREIIVEEFIPTYVITIHQRHRGAGRQTDGQTDDMNLQDRALRCSASRGKNQFMAKICSTWYW